MSQLARIVCDGHTWALGVGHIPAALVFEGTEHSVQDCAWRLMRANVPASPEVAAPGVTAYRAAHLQALLWFMIQRRLKGLPCSRSDATRQRITCSLV